VGSPPGQQLLGVITSRESYGAMENNFDELKNQLIGFTTQDRKRCQIMGRIIALVYNGWTIFMRLGIPGKPAAAITSRPLALHGVA
jgi:hypothetical protein